MLQYNNGLSECIHVACRVIKCGRLPSITKTRAKRFFVPLLFSYQRSYATGSAGVGRRSTSVLHLNNKLGPYFNPTYTRTGWIGQPPVLDRHEVVTIDGDVVTLRQATP